MRDDLRDWIASARAVKVRAELERRGAYTKAMRNDNGVPCPGCGGRDRFAINERKNVWQCRASGTGGDAIALAMHIDGSDFFRAVETVTGMPKPNGKRDEALELAELARMQEHVSQAKEAEALRVREQDEASQRFREAERRAARQLWENGLCLPGSPAAKYLAMRGVSAPEGAKLRFHPRVPLWDGPKNLAGRVIHEGPAMLAAIEGPDGKFAGVQRIWIDLKQPKGKALIIHPETGEILPSKKVRGSIKGGSILLRKGSVESDFPGDSLPATRLFLGEGIETVLSVYCALMAQESPLLNGAEFRSAVSLGNLAGKAAGRIKHPTEVSINRKGHRRPVMVPDGEPEFDGDFFTIPVARSITDLWLLGDGDSEPLFTRLALERAAKRFARAYPWLTVRLAMADHGGDFNDMICDCEVA